MAMESHAGMGPGGYLDELVGQEPGRVRSLSATKQRAGSRAASTAGTLGSSGSTASVAATAATTSTTAKQQQRSATDKGAGGGGGEAVPPTASVGDDLVEEYSGLIVAADASDDEDPDAIVVTGQGATAAAAGAGAAGVDDGEGAAAAPGADDDDDGALVGGGIDGGAGAGTARPQRAYANEDQSMASWVNHRKHIFILSSAGKPIYTKYGDDMKLSTLMGIIQAIISFIAEDNDTIRSIRAGEHLFAFLLRGPIYLVAVARTGENEYQLRDQLQYMYSHVVSVLTLTQITRIFQQRNNYDLRNLLSHSDNLLMDGLARTMDRNPAHLLGSIQCLRLSPTARATIGQVIHDARIPDLLYAIMLVGDRIITLVRPRRHSLHPSDLHLLFNMVNSVSSFRSAPESWTPVCLPKFNARGFLYAHVSFLEQSDVCLLLLTNERDRFFELSETRSKILLGLKETGVWPELLAAIPRSNYSVLDVGIPGLRHFLYMSRSTMQFTAPCFEAPYNTKAEQMRLFRFYQYMHHRAHMRARPRRIHYVVGQTEVRALRLRSRSQGWLALSANAGWFFFVCVSRALARRSCLAGWRLGSRCTRCLGRSSPRATPLRRSTRSRGGSSGKRTTSLSSTRPCSKLPPSLCRNCNMGRSHLARPPCTCTVVQRPPFFLSCTPEQ